MPHTDAERAFIILAMGIGGAVYAYIIGGVCGVLAGLNARSTDFHKVWGRDGAPAVTRGWLHPDRLAPTIVNVSIVLQGCTLVHRT